MSIEAALAQARATIESATTEIVLKRAADLLDELLLEKRVGAQLWGSSGGKSRIANRLIPLFPEHKTYCEAFAGGAAVFWAKEKDGTEVLNDMDAEIAGALRFVQGLTDAQVAELKRMDWKVTEAHHKKLQASNPTSPAAKFHKMAMLRYGGFMRNPDGGMDRGKIGATLDLFDRLQKAKERLAGVKIHSEDYRKVMAKYDGPDAFFFLDPPYTKTDQNLGERGFDHKEFWSFLGKLKGKFMVTYDAPDPDKKFNLQILEHAVTDGSGGSNRVYKTHVITNYKAKKIAKAEDDDEITKRLWGSAGGKKLLARRLVGMMPAHKKYVEAFAGGAAVFYAKQKGDVAEVLNDLDPDIAFAFKFVRDCTDEDIAALGKMDWKATPASFARVKGMKPSGARERFYKFIFLRWASFFSRGGQDTLSPSKNGQRCMAVDRMSKARERLKGVEISSVDYRKLKSHDGPDTLWFFDPPFPRISQLKIPGEQQFDEGAFIDFCKSLKGKVLITYDGKRLEKLAGFHARRVTYTLPGVGKTVQITIASNYNPTKKDEHELVEEEELLEDLIEDADPMPIEPVEKVVRLLPVDKADEEKRIVFGVVLEPDEVDAQGDTISAEEIEQTAHEWLAKYQNRGLMHRKLVNGKVRIFESYIAPSNLTIGGQRVKKGTWLLMYHVPDDEIWQQVKAGKLAGFSMGGFARRVPARAA